jgi:hypothetical protein
VCKPRWTSEPARVSIAFGVVLRDRPGIGAVTLALLVGLFNLIYATWWLVQGIEQRRTGKTRHSVPSRGRESGREKSAA